MKTAENWQSLLRTPTDFAVTTDPLQCLPRSLQLSKLWTSAIWAEEIPCFPDPVQPHTTALGTLPHWAQVTACYSVPSLAGEDLPLPKSVYKIWRGYCSYKCTDTCAELYESRRIKAKWFHQRNTLNLHHIVPKKWRHRNYPTRDSK